MSAENRQSSPLKVKRTWGGWRPNSGRKSRGVATKLQLVRKLNALDRTQQPTLAPLLAAETAAAALAARALNEWDQARVALEIAIELRSGAVRVYLEARAGILEKLAALGPVRPGTSPDQEDTRHASRAV